MSWEQDISQEIETLEQAAVRFDTEQNLTNTEKNTAKTNIGFIGATATQIDNNNYRITMA